MAVARIKRAGIYKITNTANGKVYVGSASCLGSRERVHIVRLRRGDHHSVKLQRAWDKYGESAFVFEVIESIESEADMLPREQFWIDRLHGFSNGYNSCAVAGRTVGFKHTPETRARMSAAKKAMPAFSDEHRARLSAALMGHETSPETREKISAANKEAFKCPLARERLASAKRGKKWSDECRANNLAARKPWTPERRAAASERAKGRKHSDESKAKIAESNRRRTITAEHLANMSAGASRAHRRKTEAVALGD